MNSAGASFKSRIVEPLEAVVGEALLAVNYWILDCDSADFLEEQPNASGILVVSLRFGASRIEIAPGWEKSLRANGIYYHIQAFPSGEPGSVEAVEADNLAKVAATHAAPWREVIGELLTRVEVEGLAGTPQAIRLSFTGTEIVVATGYSGSSLVAGDGDELLIFSGQEWCHPVNDHQPAWEKLWASSSAAHDQLLAR